MVQKRGDTDTLDLLNDWKPPEIVKRYDPKVVQTVTLRARIAHAIAETMKTSGLTREKIAEEMSAWLGEDVSVNMLDAFASEAKETHTISFVRVLALIHVTGDVRMLNVGAELFEHAVIPEKFTAAVEEAMLSEKIESLNISKKIARKKWQRGGS